MVARRVGGGAIRHGRWAGTWRGDIADVQIADFARFLVVFHVFQHHVCFVLV